LLALSSLPKLDIACKKPSSRKDRQKSKEMRQPRIERGAHRMLRMATMDFTTKPLTLIGFDAILTQKMGLGTLAFGRGLIKFRPYRRTRAGRLLTSENIA
jgi:hypothetical protein